MVWAHLFLMACIPFGVGGAVAWILRRRMIASARRASNAACGELTEARHPDADVIRGRVRIEGSAVVVDAVPRWERVAIARPFASALRTYWQPGEWGPPRTAARIFVEDGEQSIELVDEVELTAGARIQWTGDQSEADGLRGSVVWSAVFDGDEIVAVGVLGEEARDHHAGSHEYRSAAAASVLRGKGGSVRVAATGGRSPRWRHESCNSSRSFWWRSRWHCCFH